MATLERPVEEVTAGSSSLSGEVPASFPTHELATLTTDPDPAPTHDSVDRQHLPPSYEDDNDHPLEPYVDAHHPHAGHPAHHSRHPSASVPPTYPHEERPSYDNPSRSTQDEYPQDKTEQAESSAQAVSAEKMRLDLDSVTAAISRLYEVAPQLGDQRVELNAKKRDELELARMVGRGRMTDQQATDSKGKQVETRREAELQKIWQSIEHAHGRRLDQQEADMQPSTSASASKEREQKQQAFMEDLVARTSAGRMHGQDCSPSSPLTTTSTYAGERQDLITVDQFIKELGTESETHRSSAAPTTSTSSAPSARRSSFVPAFVGSIGRRASVKQEPASTHESLPDGAVTA